MHRCTLFLFCYLFSVSVIAQNNISYSHGATVRGDSTKKEIAIIFTADEFGEGLPVIIKTLKKEKIKASFFFTGRFYRNDSFKRDIKALDKEGHYLGPHSDQHILYCDWNKREVLLVTKDSFQKDLLLNKNAMWRLQLPSYKKTFFIPPFEWWNDSIATWSKQMDLILFNFTPGIRTAVDYTWPELPSYKSSKWIINHLKEINTKKSPLLNGSIILIHAGTDPRRKDKFYNRLGELIKLLKQKGYSFKRIDELLKN
jgi:endoglucanase